MKTQGQKYRQHVPAQGRENAQPLARGRVEQLDVLLCAYASPEAARKAEKKVEKFIAGAVSGAVRRSGAQLLAVADRDKKDLKGKQIQQLLKLFAADG